MEDVLIVGGGIGGLTLALFLHHVGIPCHIYESSDIIKPLGMGINLLPYATEKLAQLGILDQLIEVSIETKESVFCNKYGQIIFRRATGKWAGNKYPQLSIHRGEFHNILLSNVKKHIGAERIHMGWRLTDIIQKDNNVIAHFIDNQGNPHKSQTGQILIGCDGVHSRVRKLFYPNEGLPLYHGINMWRGVSEWEPFLSGASMLRIGLPKIGKLVIYPIKNHINKGGKQLINWVVEIEAPNNEVQNLNKVAKLDDFASYFCDWRFSWLDVPELLLASKGEILQYPMVDKNPIRQWSFDHVTLLGDAAHPMVPLGSNGAGQAILDASFLQQCLANGKNQKLALKKYENIRLPQTTKITKIDRAMVQDRLLYETHMRTNDKPFLSVDQVFSDSELLKLSEPTYNPIITKTT